MMLPRRYEIASIRPAASEFLVRYIEAEHEVTLNLSPPPTIKELHRHVLRHWPRLQFRAMRALENLANASTPRTSEVSASDVEMFSLEDIDE
jgi:hypothetical protein